MAKQIWEQSLQIKASAVMVDRCLSEYSLVQRWIGTTWEPVGHWSLELGSSSRQSIKVAGLKLKLSRIVIIREPGLVVWGFDGFLTGRNYWECQPNQQGTMLVHRWEVEINGLVGWSWGIWISQRLQGDIAEQLLRLKLLAEEQHDLSGQD